MTKQDLIKSLETRISDAESSKNACIILLQNSPQKRYFKYRIEDLHDEIIQLKKDLKWVQNQPEEKFK